MDTRLSDRWPVLVVMLAAIGVAATAGGETLLPTYDLWLRESNPGGVFENDALWAAHPGAVGENRWTVAEWDLSGLGPISSAHIEFSPRTRADAGSVQTAFLIDHGIDGLTWAGYQATKLGTESPLESLGHMTVPGGGLAFNAYHKGLDASANDLAALNTLRTSTGKLTVAFKATGGAMEWNDGANDGGPGFALDLPFRLVVNEALPPGASQHNPTRDLWVRESDPDGLYENDALWVGHPDAANVGENRWSVVEFDISGVTDITSARLDFASRSRADGGAVQQAFLIAPGIDGLTWNGYHAAKLATEQPFERFGELTVPLEGVTFNQYLRGQTASLADLALLNAVRTGSGLLTVAFKSDNRAVEWNDGSNAGGPGFGPDVPVRLILNADAPPPTTPSGLWRVDFDDASEPAPHMGNEAMAAAASANFDDPDGLWANPTVPHHSGGLGGISGFSRTILDSHGLNPITWTHLGGDNLRAADSNESNTVLRDFWFFSKDSFVDWQISGLIPGAEYEMFHYGGWPLETGDDERVVIILDTDGDGSVDDAQIAGFVEGGLDGVHFSSIIAAADGTIRGRWEGLADAPSWADTAGFQLALKTIPEPATLLILAGGMAMVRRRR